MDANDNKSVPEPNTISVTVTKDMTRNEKKLYGMRYKSHVNLPSHPTRMMTFLYNTALF